MAVQIQLRRDLAAVWELVNPILADGEYGLEKDTGQHKIGDGILHWKDLNYIGVGPKGEQAILDTTLVADENLGGGRIVAVFDGSAHYASPLTDYLSILGITRTAAVMGDPVEVLLQGFIADPAWSFIEGPIWLVASGLMTQTEPTTGVSLIIGWATGPTSFFFKPEMAIVRD